MPDSTPPTNCPKCHTPLPDGLYHRTEALCPVCGLVFAKYRVMQERVSLAKITATETIKQNDNGLLSLLMSVPENISRERFFAGVIGFLLFFFWGGGIALLDYRTGAINQSFIHGPLLVFHEAGHVIFRIFGEFMTALGGTLGQLLMPLVMLIALLRNNRDTLGASLALWLLGVCFMDIAPYVYDALEPQLPLLNGATGEDGGHDWIYILSETNLLSQAHALGRLVHGLGVFTLGVSALWAMIILIKQWCLVKNEV